LKPTLCSPKPAPKVLSVPRDCKTAVLAICQDFKLCFNPHMGLNKIEVKLNLNGQNNQGGEQTLKSAPGEEQTSNPS
jgi:hypothetical protein